MTLSWVGTHGTAITVIGIIISFLTVLTFVPTVHGWILAIMPPDEANRKIILKSGVHLSVAFTIFMIIIIFLIFLFIKDPEQIKPIALTDHENDHSWPSVMPKTKPSPQKISDPLWSDLQTTLGKAGSLPSPDSDLTIKRINDQIHDEGLRPSTLEQNQELQEADEAIERLAQSDARLNKFRASVAAWQARSPCELPTAFDADARLTDYDHQRLSDTEYQQGIRVLAEARALLSWQDKGLSRKTPVFIFSSSQAEIPKSIAGKLQSRLAGRLNVVGWQHAAACIDLKSAIRNSFESDDSDGSSTLRLKLYFEARWLAGIAIDIATILTSPVIQAGTISSINTDTLEQATAIATAEAERQLLSLTRTASDP